jgi:hypothetical protein
MLAMEQDVWLWTRVRKRGKEGWVEALSIIQTKESLARVSGIPEPKLAIW